MTMREWLALRAVLAPTLEEVAVATREEDAGISLLLLGLMGVRWPGIRNRRRERP